MFQDPSLVIKCFWSLFLSVIEYCSAVWRSAVDGHLSLLDRVVYAASHLSGGLVTCDLWHRPKIVSLCMFYEIYNAADHPVRMLLPALYVPS